MSDSGFMIVNTQPKTCDEIHAECRSFASAVPAHRHAIFECERCGKQFDSKQEQSNEEA
jgi:hypothetical protein